MLRAAAWGDVEMKEAKAWREADIRINLAFGPKGHILAGYSGGAKSMIGGVPGGLRPTDQGMNEGGRTLDDTFLPLAQVAGIGGLAGGIFSRRVGMEGALARIDEVQDEAAKRELRKLAGEGQGFWDRAKGFAQAFGQYEAGVAALKRELKSMRDDGVPEDVRMSRMRTEMQRIVEDADKREPGFQNALVDALHSSTSFFMRLGTFVRIAIPEEMRDVGSGRRIAAMLQGISRPHLTIGAVTHATPPYSGPDDSIRFQTMRGGRAAFFMSNETGGFDLAAWTWMRQHLDRPDDVLGKKSFYEDNYPLWGMLTHGQGPMHASQLGYVP